MQTTYRPWRRATYTAIAVVLFGFGVGGTPTQAQGATELPVSLLATTTGRAMLEISEATLNSYSLQNQAYSVKSFVTNAEYGLVSNPQWCFPRSSGSTAFPLTGGISFLLNFAEHQTANTSGGSPNCDVTGTYYIVFLSGSNSYYISYNYNRDTNEFSAVPFNPNTSFTDLTNLDTRFTGTNITLSSSNDFTITTSYYIDPLEYDPTDPQRSPTRIRYSFLRTNNNSEYIFNRDITTLLGSSSSSTRIVDLPNGNYRLRINFSNLASDVTNILPFDKAFMVLTFNMVGGVVQNVSSVANYDYKTKTNDLELFVYRDCSLTQFDNCIINAFMFLIVPSQASLQNLEDLNNTLSTKFPFAYLYDVNELINMLFTTAQTQSATLTVPFGVFGDITLMSEDMLSDVPFSTTIRTILSYLLWVMFAMLMYNQTKRIFDNNHTTP